MRSRLRSALWCVASALLLATPGASFAQGFHSVFSRDGTDVWAVGDDGVIYRSLSGGTTWTNLALGSRTLRGVGAVGLNVLVVGDSGKVWHSQDSGGNWSVLAIPGAPDLRAVVATSFADWVAVGAGGTILKSVDGGGSLSPRTSGTAVSLNAVRFTDASNGWVVGDAGTVLHTTDGGDTWLPVDVTSTAALFDVDVNGSTIWVVGADGTARRSVNGGANWSIVDLKLDARADVRSVWLTSPSTVFLAGGGGFIRKSTNGGQTWIFPKHSMQAPVVSLFFAAGRAWACSDANRIVLTSVDADTTWALPSGATMSRTMSKKLHFAGNNVRGSTIGMSPVDKHTFYAAMGNTIYRSRNDGETWSAMATVPSSIQLNTLVVSPKDTNTMVVAIGPSPNRLAKTTDGGANWTTTLSHTFGGYGIPIEMDPDHTDTLYFGGDEDVLYRSTDFGSSWSPYSTVPLKFRSPCDIVVVPDSSNIILVGDGVTSNGKAEYWKSTNRGATFTLVSTRQNGASEIPGLACSRLRNNVTFGTNWCAGGVQRSTDYGGTWPNVSNQGSAWGIGIAHDDPNCVIFGTYTDAQRFLSLDGGASFSPLDVPLFQSNYSFYARDRALILIEESDGIYKLDVAYTFSPTNTQSVTVTSPNGGEVWMGGSQHNITWTSQNLALASVEYQKSASDPWQLVAQTPGYSGTFSWTVPLDATTTARIRVRDAWDSNPIDTSNGTFTITVTPQLVIDPNPLDLPATLIGEVAAGALQIHNPAGAGSVSVTSVTSNNPAFWPGRTAFTVPAQSGDTLGIFFSPTAEGPDSAQVTIVSNDPGSPRVVRVTGSGTSLAAVGQRTAARFALWQNQPNPFTSMTRIEYALPVTARVRLDVFDLMGKRIATLVDEKEAPGVHHASFGPGARTASGEHIAALPSGVYFYRFAAGSFASTRKMLVLR